MSIFVIFAGSALLCTILRFIQLGALDFDTGFYVSGTGALEYLVYIAVILTFAAVLYVAVRSSRFAAAGDKPLLPLLRDSGGVLPRGIAGVAGGVYVFAGLLLLIGGIAGLTADTRDMFGSVTAFVRAAGFAALSHNLLYRKECRASVGFASLIISVSYILSAVAVFRTHLVIRHSSSPLTIMMTYLAFAFFYFYVGRIFARIEEGGVAGTRVKAAAVGVAVTAWIISECAGMWLYLALNSEAAHTLAVIPADGVLVPALANVAESAAAVLLLLTFSVAGGTVDGSAVTGNAPVTADGGSDTADVV